MVKPGPEALAFDLLEVEGCCGSLDPCEMCTKHPSCWESEIKRMDLESWPPCLQANMQTPKHVYRFVADVYYKIFEVLKAPIASSYLP